VSVVRRFLAACLLIVAAAVSSGCLVLNVHPAYDDDTIGWDPALVGSWVDSDDNVTVDITGGEWKSYKIRYAHPIEKGELTGYLTSIGDERYLDVMPARGEDRGSFVVPVHATLRVRLEGDTLEVAPLSYDWFADLLKAKGRIGLSAAFDQKENVLIVGPTTAYRAWLRRQPRDGKMFGAAATFTRAKK
jgi:hypothetical protein